MVLTGRLLKGSVDRYLTPILCPILYCCELINLLLHIFIPCIRCENVEYHTILSELTSQFTITPFNNLL